MEASKRDYPELEIKRWVNQVALICMSDDFISLKKELERLYLKSNMDNVRLSAFQDALYAFMTQHNEEIDFRSNVR